MQIDWGQWQPSAYLKFEDGALMQLWKQIGRPYKMGVVNNEETRIYNGTMREMRTQWRPVPGQSGVTDQSKMERCDDGAIIAEIMESKALCED